MVRAIPAPHAGAPAALVLRQAERLGPRGGRAGARLHHLRGGWRAAADDQRHPPAADREAARRQGADREVRAGRDPAEIAKLGLEAGDACSSPATRRTRRPRSPARRAPRSGTSSASSRRPGFEFCWIVDFPMFEWNEDEKQVDFSHNPFSMPQGGLEALEGAGPARPSRPTSTTSSATASSCRPARSATTGRRSCARPSRSPATARTCWRRSSAACSSALHLWRAAAWRHRARRRPHRHAALRRAEPARGRPLPDEPAGRGPLMGAPSEVSAKQLRELHIRPAPPPAPKG